MASVAWEITHSVETNASPDFAWHYWTNVANWDDPPAKFELDGPFATESRGVTRVPGQEPLYWLIREVTPPNAAMIEISLDGAALSFDCRFVALADGRTRLTQRIVLTGENADIYVSQLKTAFTANLPDGMNKLAIAMANADPTVRSRRKVYGQLLEHARRQPHRECCGILAGQGGLITQVFPAKNVAADPVRNYEIAPKEIVRLMGELRKRRLQFLGIYHSHPHRLDTNEPSPRDIALAYYSEAIYFIVTPRPYATTPIRAFSIRDGRAMELEIQILP